MIAIARVSRYGRGSVPSVPVLNEAGASQPTLDVIRKLALALSVSADLLLFGKNERGPDEDLRLQFEAVSRFDADEKRVVRSLLEGMILKHEAKRWSDAERK